MKEVIERLQIQINSVGQQMEQERTTFEVSTTDDINSLAPSSPGIYWIDCYRQAAQDTQNKA